MAVQRLDARAMELAQRSCAWGALHGAGARLLIGTPSDEALVLGAFQRTAELPAMEGGPELVRRGSGGGAARVGPGTVWLQLALARPDALVECTADKLLNRYVRPLLRALTRSASVPASYFGRDWISTAHRPVALVAFAHDASTQQALFEAIVAVSTPFASGDRPSFRGKAPATLEAVAGRPIDRTSVADAIEEAYRALATAVVDAAEAPAAPTTAEALPEPPWDATRDEAIGTIGAARDASGRVRIGGELMASRDAIARLQDLVADLPPDATSHDVGEVVDEAMSTRGAITFGVRSLASIRDVIVEAMRSQR